MGLFIGATVLRAAGLTGRWHTVRMEGSLTPRPKIPPTGFVVECEVTGDKGPQTVSLHIVACDDDDAGDLALYALERARITDIRRVG